MPTSPSIRTTTENRKSDNIFLLKNQMHDTLIFDEINDFIANFEADFFLSGPKPSYPR